MKIVVFGIGKFYQKRREKLLSYTDIELVAAIDNNQNMQGTYINGVPVFSVDHVITINFDIILLMSVKANEMKKQLLDLGINANRIWYWERLESEQNRGIFNFYYGQKIEALDRKKVLIISTDIGYNGGSLAAVYAAKALQERKYNVMLAVPGGNLVFIKEIKNSGLNVMICSALPYLYNEELFFVEQFDFVIVNVLQMILCASEISKRKPVFWWIHEPSAFYKPVLEQFSDYAIEKKINKVNIFAVSRIAQKSFNHYFPGRVTKTFAYGIPDERKIVTRKDSNRFTFAIIGGICPIKAQDIFLMAVKILPLQIRNNALFWIIGSIGQDLYSEKIKKMISEEPSAVLLGELTRKEIQKAYMDIDVLICSSLEDCLPIVVTEAMMYGKVCIVSDLVGMADYICDGENGFIFQSGDANALAEKMRWIFDNQKQLSRIGKNARQTYEKNFTMDSFGERLEETLLQTINECTPS